MEIVLFSQCPQRLKPAHLSILHLCIYEYICFVRLQIELFDLMKKNGFLCKCIIIVLPTIVFPLSLSFSIGKYTECAVISVDKNFFIMTHCGSRRSGNSKQRLA